MQIVSLETERLVLRQWREQDKPAFADLNSDTQVREFFLETLSRIESDAMFTRYAEFIAELGWGMWAVEEKVSTNLVGVVGLNIPKAEMPFSPCVEIAWRLAVPYWGLGYATEAASAVLAFGFEKLQLDEIVAFTTLQNKRSQEVMRKLRMQKVLQEFMHPAVPVGHPLQAHYLYKISQADWRLHNK